MVKIKICGLTNMEDAKICVSLGVDFIGFVFAESPRRITKEDAKGIISGLPSAVKKVGVFVNEAGDAVEDVARHCGLDVLQFHGDESPDYCLHFGGFEIFKAFRLRAKEDLEKLGCPVVLSGGLDAGNVGEAIRKVRPEIVDVSSGVESAPGRKDADKLREFVESVRGDYAA
jgi:phosphoribosylanthranilate isomerase